jgi:hypothetical protein
MVGGAKKWDYWPQNTGTTHSQNSIPQRGNLNLKCLPKTYLNNVPALKLDSIWKESFNTRKTTLVNKEDTKRK